MGVLQLDEHHLRQLLHVFSCFNSIKRESFLNEYLSFTCHI